MRHTLRYSATLLASLLAIYVIAFHGFDAVARQVTKQLRFYETAGPRFLLERLRPLLASSRSALNVVYGGSIGGSI